MILKQNKAKEKQQNSIFMRRTGRFLLKWFLMIGLFTFVFKLCCDSLVDIFISVSRSSITTMVDRHADSSYEQSLIAWAATGQQLKNDKLSTEGIKNRNDLQLIGAQVFFRHGARTPLNLLPNIEEVLKKQEKYSNLVVKKYCLQVVYTKEQLHHYPPSVWEIKLIPKIGDKIVSKDRVLSSREAAGDEIQKLKVNRCIYLAKRIILQFQSKSGENVTTGQLTSLGEKQMFELGRLLRAEFINESNENGLIPATYDSQYVLQVPSSYSIYIIGKFSFKRVESFFTRGIMS